MICVPLCILYFTKNKELCKSMISVIPDYIKTGKLRGREVKKDLQNSKISVCGQTLEVIFFLTLGIGEL